jgi:hypothetical protein
MQVMVARTGGASGQYENSLRSKEKDVTLAISKKTGGGT